MLSPKFVVIPTGNVIRL